MTSIPGVDYAWSHPGGAALKTAGIKFACRYLSSDLTKNLTKAEATDLAAHGVSCVVVWETTATRALSGKAGGTEDAKKALAQATAAGMPSGRPIYFALDWDASATQQAAINAYLDAVAAVIGRARVGIYGGYYPVKRALDAGKASWAWQTMAWSGGRWDPRAVIHQGAQKTINRVSCDLNTANVVDYGQWTPGKAPATTPKPKPTFAPFPGAAWFSTGRTSPIVGRMHDRLVAVGCNRYKSSANKNTIGSGDKSSYQAWQRKCGFTGAAAEWPPGKSTWDKLHVPA